MTWILKHPQMTHSALGFLPVILIPDDKRDAAEQLNDRYAHGGGARSISGYRRRDGTEHVVEVPEEYREEYGETYAVPLPVIHYPGDGPQKPLAFSPLWAAGQVAVFYSSQMVGIFQLDTEDESFNVYRVD